MRVKEGVNHKFKMDFVAQEIESKLTSWTEVDRKQLIAETYEDLDKEKQEKPVNESEIENKIIPDTVIQESGSIIQENTRQEEIKEIAENPNEPTFKNTLEALESSGETLDKVSNVFYNLLGSNTDDEMDALAVKMSPLMSSHNDQILLNQSLFKRIETLINKSDSLDLTNEQEVTGLSNVIFSWRF